MNFKVNESATKLRGGYYTDPEIAEFLIRWVLEGHPERLLEPSCGDGVFFRTLAAHQTNGLRSVTGFEIEPAEARKSRAETAYLGCDAQVHGRDFLAWSLGRLQGSPLFDAAVGNPPFIRYQYLDPALQNISAEIFRALQLPFTKHTNAWVPFVLASAALLRPGGRMAMVVPSEILHVLHAQSLRTYLARVCRRVLIIDPQEIWFEGTLQGAVLLLAEKKQASASHTEGVCILQTKSRNFLYGDPETLFQEAAYANGDTITGKWMPALLSEKERALLKLAASKPGVFRFADIAAANVGIVTGANKFFLVPDEIVDEFQLHRWAHPMFGRSGHVPGVVYDAGVHAANKARGVPANFIWFKDEPMATLPKSVQKYIKSGETDELHTRFKCRIRQPWYSVPSVFTTPVGMLKRCHDFPRLILNKANAYTTDTAYRVQPKEGVDGAGLVYSFVNSLTALTAELEGRHYGGGVLELVPSEIAKLLVPLVSVSERALLQLDSLIRHRAATQDVLAAQDHAILSRIGFTPADILVIAEAASRLRARRQRETRADDVDGRFIP